MKILVTGAAGFIGFHVIHRLLEEGHTIIGIDNLNDYYDTQLKIDRLRELGIEELTVNANAKINFKSTIYANLFFRKIDISEDNSLQNISMDIDIVCHLAAQAGVRASIDNPGPYIKSNINGFANILELARIKMVKHLVFASSSSVYGMNKKIPFSTDDRVDYPVSLYAATKKSNEVMAYSYSHLYSIPVTGLRFFTVYGPWGRPDMAYFIFTKAILDNKTIKVFNEGEMERDFTYIDDIVKGIQKVLISPPDILSNDYSNSKAPFKLYNIGKNAPVNLLKFIETLEIELGKEAIKEFLPMQEGDVPITYADSSELMKDFNFKPQTDLKAGIKIFVKWYKEYYETN